MQPVNNGDIADAFDQIADLLEITGGDPFRVGSYRKVARVVGESGDDVADLSRQGKAETLPGVGKSSAQKIGQLVEHGKIDLLEELKAQVPPGLPDLMRIPGLGPKTIQRMWKDAGVKDLKSLADAIEGGGLENVPGLGTKKIRQIFEGLQFVASAGRRTRLGDAVVMVERVCAAMRQAPGVEEIVAAGSFRRGRETVGDLDFVCQAPPEKADEIIEAFTKMRVPPVRKVLAAGGTKASVVLDRDLQADLRVVGPESFGAAMQYFTGSKEHSIRLREIAVKKGWKLNEYGLFDGEKRLAGPREEEVYQRLGLQFIPPELREDRGEVQAALEGKLPTLLELKDIRGDLHMHTTASDGLEDIGTMIQACVDRGYKYMAISEHSHSQVQAGGLSDRQLIEHGKAVAEAAKKFKGIHVYYSCEVDILKDGSLDYPDSVLEHLDFVIASPHAALNMKRAEATKRLIKAIQHPLVRVIGHPSGRLINARQGMELDVDEIAAAAAEHGVSLEINAHLSRLDLSDLHVRAAITRGARIMINTDAHGIADLDNMRFGVLTARRGWAQSRDVVNTLSATAFRQWVKRA